MSKEQEESVARALAAAYYRGDDRHQYDRGPKEFERDVKQYVEANWERWLPAAQAVLSMNDEQPVKPLPVKPFPRYAKLGMTALRNTGGGVYYRDAGGWSVKTKWKDGKLVVGKEQGHLAHLSGAELVPCDRKAWKEDNKGYTTVNMSPRKCADADNDTIPF